MEELNYETMIQELKDNILVFESEGKTTADFAFASQDEAADFYQEAIKHLPDWSIATVESRLVPKHYRNSATLVRIVEESKDFKDEEETEGNV